jgi:hypothetical protein
MSNTMLSFSGADLTRLRTLVTAVDEEIVLVPGAATTAERQTPRTTLDITWSHLVDMLHLGAEPEMRACPGCKHLCPLGATRCSHCCGSLPSLRARGKLAA